MCAGRWRASWLPQPPACARAASPLIAPHSWAMPMVPCTECKVPQLYRFKPKAARGLCSWCSLSTPNGPRLSALCRVRHCGLWPVAHQKKAYQKKAYWLIPCPGALFESQSTARLSDLWECISGSFRREFLYRYMHFPQIASAACNSSSIESHESHGSQEAHCSFDPE